mgnify:CR=1 FL=1
MTELMLSNVSNDDQIPDWMRYRNRLKKDLCEVEEYLHSRCKELNIKLEYDLSANEPLNWKGLTYTTYNGMLYVSSMSQDATLYQLYDALRDNLRPTGHIDFIRKSLNDKCHGKYLFGDKSEFNVPQLEPYTHVCILPGHNKFNHISKEKIGKMVDKHGKNLVFKPHPITHLDILEENGFLKYIDKCQVASQYDDMYTLIENAKHVYTTHISETALSSLVLGKSVEPFDSYEMRHVSGFSPISHFCYTEEEPIEIMGKIFASPKSGIIHPLADKDWKNKINLYLKYTIDKRDSQEGYYV